MIFAEGKDVLLYIKFNGIWCPISCETSNSISESSSMINTTTRDNKGWETSLPTRQSYNIDAEGMAVKEDLPNTLSYWRLVNMKRTREKIEWKIESLSGYYTDVGLGYISDISKSSPAGDFVKFNFTLNGYGKPE